MTASDTTWKICKALKQLFHSALGPNGTATITTTKCQEMIINPF